MQAPDVDYCHYPAGMEQRSWQLLLLISIKNKKKQQLDPQEEAARVFSPAKTPKILCFDFCLDEFTAIPKLSGGAGNETSLLSSTPPQAKVQVERANSSLIEVL